MKCKKCGNEIEENEIYCGKCGERVKIDKKKIKNYISIFAIIIFIIIVITSGLYFYEKDIKVGNITINNPMSNFGITNKYLTNNFKENGFDQFDDVDVKILAIKDIEYNNFNKVVLANTEITNDGIKISNTGLLLVNRKENIVDSFTINNNLIFILNGLNNNTKQKSEDILEICANYIQNYGTDIFANIENDNFKSLIKNISNKMGIQQAREYAKSGFKKLNNGNLQYTLLFDKDSALVRYIAFYTDTLKYNSRYPIDERTYKYLSKDYSYRSTLNTFEYIYGPAYSMVKQYEVYSVSDNSKLIGAYQNLETAKTKLNVEE